MEILPLTSAEFADSLISDVFYEIATTVDKLMTNSKKDNSSFYSDDQTIVCLV
jgi:hypothetical protein